MSGEKSEAVGLERIRRFVNSVPPGLKARARYWLDPSTSPDELPQWLLEDGALPQATPQELSEVRAFREALRNAVEANAGYGDPQQAWRGLQPFADRCSLKVEMRDYGPVLRAGEAGECAVIGGLLAEVYQAVANGTWGRLKACREETCRWALIDQSKNGSRAWCEMSSCGNRMKARRRRQALKKGA